MGNSTSHANESLDKGFTRGTYGDVKNTASSFRFSKRSPKKMDRLRRSFRESFRRRKDRVPESSKPHQWQADDQAVRSSTCSFPVKYMGCVEVFESRGMQVCEEALKVLRNSHRRAIRGLLHVSGDGLRVVDDDTKGLIVDQTIEKVSFCAPDRNHERGFSYICRDGTTRRWMCHGFLASKDSGERLSHAVGCAFAVCLERKQRRDTECGVTMTFDMKNSTFTRSGSFRTQTMTERLQNNERGVDIGGPPAAIVPPQPKPHNPFAIERPHATPMILERLERQGSFRAVSNQSPFKRQMSLRINDLPSNAERQKAFLDPRVTNGHHIRSVSPIPEVSPNKTDTVTQLCQELSQGLSLLTRNDENDDFNFNNIMSKNQNAVVSLIGSPITPPLYRGISMFSSATTTTTTPPTNVVQPNRKTPETSPPKLESALDFNKSPITSVTDLPKPDQWLAGQIVQSTVAQQSPRRAPTLSMRTKSLNNGSDPFDAEWVEGVTQVNKAVAPTTLNLIAPPPPTTTTALNPIAAVTTTTTTLNPIVPVNPIVPLNNVIAPTTTTIPFMPQQQQHHLHHNTNPFISPPKPPAQSFQVQL